MNWSDFLSSAHVQHLALALIHNLWQGAIVAFALVGLLRLIPARKANVRYAACLSAMTFVLVCGLATWGWLNIRAGYVTANATVGESVAASSPIVAPSVWNWQVLLVAVWLAGVLFMLLRLALSFCQVQQLKQKSRDASTEVQSLVGQIAKRCGLNKPLHVLVSDTISSAAVVGVLKPVLFLPASMVTGLNASQLEAVIAHEIAHIRRFDPIVNFCQMLIEALLFFNPAVFWIGRQIRMEREACCDAVGVTATGDQSMYLDTLAFWAEQMRNHGASAPVATLAFADRQKSTLLDRVRRVLFPDFVPATRFSPISTVFLFAIGITLLATLWQGTMVAVAIADELLPHEQIVAELIDTRDKYEGKPVELEKPIESTGPMTVKMKLETEDGQPMTSRIWTHYDTYAEKEGHSKSHSGTLDSVEPGETETTFVIKQGWANILVTGDDYVPVTFRNLRPDENGNAEIVVPLLGGYPGKLKVVNESGEPIPNATISLSKVLRYKTEKRTSAGTKSTRTGGTGVVAGTLTTDADGVAIIAHATDQPVFAARVKAPGFEQTSEDSFGIVKGTPHKIVMKRSLPIVGIVSDGQGQPLKDVKLHILSSVKKTHSGSNHRSLGGNHFCQKEFGDAAAVTSDTGQFSIDSLESGWTYNLVADAGDRGVATCFGVRPGDEDVAIEIAGAIDISGTVTGELDRLKQGDDYVLRYGINIVSPDGSTNGDSSGRLVLEVVDGKGTFRLENVVPGKFRFYESKDGHCAFFRNLEIAKSIDDLEIVIPEHEPRHTETRPLSVARTARLQFQSGIGVAPFRGQISVSSRVENGESYFERPIEVVDGVAEFEVNSPTKLSVELMDAPGFVFDEGLRKIKLKVDDAEGDFEDSLEVFPAGAVVGRIKVAERREGAWMGVFGWMRFGNRSTTISDQCDEDGKFYLPNVPYGATFRLMARHGSNCKPIDVLDVDESNPLFEATITLEDGPVLRGNVLDSAGKPFSERPISLRVSVDGSGGFESVGETTTNRNGEFDFGPVNPEFGEYKIWIESKREHAQAVLDVAQLDEPLEIKLARGLIIQGRLVNDETGEPIPDASVYATAPVFQHDAIYAYEAEAKTDANGVFQFSNLNEGDYRLATRVVMGRVVNDDDVPAGTRDVLLRVTTAPRPPRAAEKIPPTH